MKYVVKHNEGVYENDEGFVLFLCSIPLVLGIIFLLPPLLGIVSYFGKLFGASGSFFSLSNLSDCWTYGVGKDGGGGMSAAPIYLGLMGLIGTFLIGIAYRTFISFVKINIDSEKIKSIELVESEEKK